MLKNKSHQEMVRTSQRHLDRYEAAGLSPAECLADIRSGTADVCYENGYSDGVIVGGIALFIGGLICKALERRTIRQTNEAINRRITNGMYVKSLTEMAEGCVPKASDEDDQDRDKNT